MMNYVYFYLNSIRTGQTTIDTSLLLNVRIRRVRSLKPAAQKNFEKIKPHVLLPRCFLGDLLDRLGRLRCLLGGLLGRLFDGLLLPARKKAVHIGVATGEIAIRRTEKSLGTISGKCSGKIQAM